MNTGKYNWTFVKHGVYFFLITKLHSDILSLHTVVYFFVLFLALSAATLQSRVVWIDPVTKANFELQQQYDAFTPPSILNHYIE
jgi:hypothetical protein